MPTTDSPASFSPTRWSLVVRAKGKTPEARAALNELCEAYYQPVFRFLQRDGRKVEEAQELTQAFFAKVLQVGDLGADRGRGRFRSYLLGAVKHFLADDRKAQQRLKRGSGVPPLSLDADGNDSQPPIQPRTEAPDDTFFDRQWALAVMDRGLHHVEAEWKNKGKAEQFKLLKYSLMGDGKAVSHQDAAMKLGWTESAIKVSIHRLRKRFREAIWQEIADTIPDSSDIETELQYLIEVLRTTSE